MKVHKSTQKIIELWQKDWNGNLIHVYQIDTPDFSDRKDSYDGSLKLPILVDGGGVYNITIENLLGDRKKHLDKITELENEILSLKEDEKYYIKRIEELKNKKWWTK
jgi:hypothetical protein